MDPAASLVVHALLVCRRAEAGPTGELNLEDVLEILPVAALPGDAGPVTFLALVRNLPEGPGRGAFLVRTPAPERRDIARCPLKVTVPAGYAGRQVALQVRLPSLPVALGGWYELLFEWGGTTVAETRFAVGARSGASVSGRAPAPPAP
jgi:hypothetical protein